MTLEEMHKHIMDDDAPTQAKVDGLWGKLIASAKKLDDAEKLYTNAAIEACARLVEPQPSEAMSQEVRQERKRLAVLLRGGKT